MARRQETSEEQAEWWAREDREAIEREAAEMNWTFEDFERMQED